MLCRLELVQTNGSHQDVLYKRLFERRFTAADCVKGLLFYVWSTRAEERIVLMLLGGGGGMGEAEKVI